MEKSERLLYRIKEGIFDVGYIWKKEMVSVLKDEGVLIFFILVPLFYPILYSWAYNNEVARDVPVAIVDQSRSSMSRQFARSYDATSDVAVKYYCNDLEEAKRLMGKQEIYGIVLIPSDFSTNLNRMEQSTISIYCNMGFLLYYKAIYQSAMMVTSELNKHIQISCRATTPTERTRLPLSPWPSRKFPCITVREAMATSSSPGC